MNIIIKTLIICIILIIFFYLISKIIIVSHNIILNNDKSNYNKKIEKIKKINNQNKSFNIFEKIKSNNIINQINNNNNYNNVKNIFKDFNKRLCLDHHNCIINNKKYCTYGITNYIHPNYLSEFDKKIFMENIQPNFTKQDYINWLNCYKNNNYNIKKLSYKNHKNLLKLINSNTNFNIPNIKNKKKKYLNIFINN